MPDDAAAAMDANDADAFMQYHAAMQTEALMRCYDVLLLVLAKQPGVQQDTIDQLLDAHAQGLFYFAPVGGNDATPTDR